MSRWGTPPMAVDLEPELLPAALTAVEGAAGPGPWCESYNIAATAPCGPTGALS
jgi:hypothetical protein